jgi:hypothetical protein
MNIPGMIMIDGNTNIEDFYMMSLCNHNIIANSTYSWWASYLNENKGKIVIAPDHWGGLSDQRNWNGIYYDGLIKIPNA